MTVSPNSPVTGPIVADGVAVTFPFGFKITAASQLRLRITDPDGSNGIETSANITVDPMYINQDNGGYLGYAPGGVPVANGQKVYSFREVPYSQPIRIGNQGGFFPETHEEAFDRLSMQIQQLNEGLSRALVVRIGETAPNIGDLLEDIANGEAAAIAAAASAAASAASAAAAAAAVASIPATVLNVLSGLPNRPTGDITGLAVGQWYINGGFLSRVEA